MVEYIENGDVAIVDGYKFRRDKVTGYFLSSTKINGKRMRLHKYIAETYIGHIEDGYDVHHIDGNKNNNEIDNLEIITSHNHKIEHGRRLTDEEREKRSINVTEKAMPKARKWHGTPEGLEWHRKHGLKCAEKMKMIKYTCTYCGNEFESKRIFNESENRFCHNRCKSAYRREQGLDNEDRKCQKCGDIFRTNKYSTRKYCEKCQDPKHRIRRKRGCVQLGSTANS